MFAALAARQPSPWRFFAETESWAVCSASPECFVEKRGESLWARPMKGTRPGGPKAAAQLAASEKDRAENLMIVDMTRNDMSRLPDARHVRAESLLDIHTYPTVAQMTSTVACETAAGMDGIFAAMFPPASVTGAPKIAAMQIIAGLEKESRGVYCGVCGWGDNGGFQFNVAIRTAVVDKKKTESSATMSAAALSPILPPPENGANAKTRRQFSRRRRRLVFWKQCAPRMAALSC